MERVKNFFANDFVKTLLTYILIVIVVVLIRVFLIDPFRVDGSSMDKTLSNGEVMILNKIIYRKSDIKRFDIVVVEIVEKNSKGPDVKNKIIKRVMGLPNETIEYRDNVLYINGEKMDDPYPSTETDDFSIEDVGKTKIPGDSYFVMGDNRANSLDSRYIGTVTKKQILGRAKLVIWPIKKFGIVE